MAQKRSSFETIPLCNPHHNEQHLLGWWDFTAKYDLDLQSLLAALNVKPRVYTVRASSILGPYARLNTERYWMDYQGETYVLSPIEDGPRKAAALAQVIRREWLIEEQPKVKRP